MMIELNNPNNSTRKPQGKPASRVKQADDTVSGLGDKVEDLDRIGKEYDKFKQNTRKGAYRKCGTP